MQVTCHYELVKFGDVLAFSVTVKQQRRVILGCHLCFVKRFEVRRQIVNSLGVEELKLAQMWCMHYVSQTLPAKNYRAICPWCQQLIQQTMRHFGNKINEKCKFKRWLKDKSWVVSSPCELRTMLPVSRLFWCTGLRSHRNHLCCNHRDNAVEHSQAEAGSQILATVIEICVQMQLKHLQKVA